LALAREDNLHPKLNKRTLELYESWKNRKHDKAFEEFDMETITAIDSMLDEFDPPTYDEIMPKVLVPVIDHTYMYTKGLIERLKKENYFLIAVSGSRLEEVKLFAEHHGFDDWIGQDWERAPDGKKYTGNIKKTFKDKHLLIEQFVKKHDLTYEGSYAVGDSGGDISMLEVVENPIAFNPNHTLLKRAKKEGWKIIVERKSITYELSEENGRYILA